MSTPDDLNSSPDGTIYTTDGPPSPEFYYILEAQSVDWQWLIQERIYRKTKEVEARGAKMQPMDAFVRIQGVEHPTFYLRKEIFPVEEIIRLLGPSATPEALASATLIHLKPIGDQSGWQRPSVPYAGAA